MKPRSVILAIGLALAASPALAQDVKLTSASPYGSVTAWGAYVGPYQAQIMAWPGMPTVDVYCVDYLNSVHINQTWYANFTQLSNFDTEWSNTRWGQTYIPGGYLSVADLKIQYQQAAWLSKQFYVADKSQWGGIHAAIWQIFTENHPDGLGPRPGSAAAIAAAAPWLANARMASNYNSINLDYWQVITDENTVDGQGGVQEYLVHVTPEPGTILLLATGLAGVLGAAVVGRRVV